MIFASLILIIILWFAVGCLVCVMASAVDRFNERFFSSSWLLLMGPVGLLVWYSYEQHEKKELAKAERARKRKKPGKK